MSAVSAMTWEKAYSITCLQELLCSTFSNATELVLPLFKVATAKIWDELLSPTNLFNSSCKSLKKIKFALRI